MMTAPVQDGKIRVGVLALREDPFSPSHRHPGRRQPIRDLHPQTRGGPRSQLTLRRGGHRLKIGIYLEAFW